MKSLATLYITCIIILYSMLTFIGYRKEKFGSIKEGILAEVTVSASPDKTPESKLLANHFDNVFHSLSINNRQKAKEQLLSSLLVFTIRTISNDPHNKKQFLAIANNLSVCYKDIEFNRVNENKINETFESVELFIAKEFILKSSEDLQNNNFILALKDLNNAEECIAFATKYSTDYELEVQNKLIKSSVKMVKDIIKERESEKAPAVLKRFWYRINNTEGSQV